ncbi:phosphofructokinase [Mycolicibacterium duvalii]|uniref:6-phosphofructokinase n=1 Tax=Mycolicibacterium duvalii TaxID=39688 RepID=A0A7I7K348_9MYCO|nr:1-phosphofructokinase family hexose kinase [Mycolicibacterium duvalii]MCV7367922.1 1-phosphofructokinase family hexose kinase [Mycolicibacterium duvalii]PEG42601.1 phosphofructokinase [Mycolicibacterium duvalii]BBX18487.1 6-phosphofructokinase [Mycolicibacterium duvalii]
MNGPSIVTLTMNPALDVTADADEVVHTRKIRCRAERYDAGGGGVNVARFAHALGMPVQAVFTAGGATGSRVMDLVDAEGVHAVPVTIAGQTRESFTVNERVSARQYRFVLPGPALTPEEQQRCLDALRRAAVSARFVVASGSLPPGVPPDFYQRVADLCRETAALLILDTSGAGLRQVTGGVHLLKPSLRELRECVGRAVETECEQEAAARELIDRGVTGAVVVSLGAQGALLVTPDEAERFPAVPVATVSEVGAGDAMVAGITVALARDATWKQAVCYGIAAATAKLQTPGTAAFGRREVDAHFQDYVCAGRRCT